MSKKVILLLGITGNGKSTTGNVLLNQSPDEDKILYAPFATDSGASGCTQVFNKQESDKHNLIIIDTVGFCDPNFTHEKCLDNLRKAIKSVDNKVDLFICVFLKGRLTQDDLFFFQTAKKELKNVPKSNSLLIVTKCEKGWIDLQKNAYLNEAISNCNGNYFEFDLEFDKEDDPPGKNIYNRQQRQQSIDNLVQHVNKLLVFNYNSQKVLNKIPDRFSYKNCSSIQFSTPIVY